jgi:hypothetical protein
VNSDKNIIGPCISVTTKHHYPHPPSPFPPRFFQGSRLGQRVARAPQPTRHVSTYSNRHGENGYGTTVRAVQDSARVEMTMLGDEPENRAWIIDILPICATHIPLNPIICVGCRACGYWTQAFDFYLGRGGETRDDLHR